MSGCVSRAFPAETLGLTERVLKYMVDTQDRYSVAK